MSGPQIRVSEDRNVYVDWVRAISICIVVIFHTRLYPVRLDGAGLHVGMWDPNPVWYPISWILMAIPVFFLAGGYGHSVNMLKAARLDTGYGQFLAARARRLIGPTIVFITLFAVLASIIAAGGRLDMAVEVTRSGMSLLWFITVYLLVTALAPVMVEAHEHAGPWVFTGLAVCAAAVDAAAFAFGNHEIRNANLVFVWLFVHQLGIAYHRGWFRSWPVLRLAAIALGTIALIGALIALGYPATSVGFASIPIANVQPPTITMGALGVAQACGLALFERAAPRWAQAEVALVPVRTVNALLMTVYLWHVPLIVGVNAAVWLSGLGALLGDWQRQLLVTVASVAAVAAVAPVIARLDLAMIPAMGRRQSTSMTVVAVAVMTGGIALVWRTGLVLHTSQPASTTGVLAVWVGWALLRKALNK